MVKNMPIGIIGCGNMGSAIASRNKNFLAFDKDPKKIAALKHKINVKPVGSISELVNNSKVIILAVKPQDFDDCLVQLCAVLPDQIVVSIAAGITTGYIEKKIGGKIKVIRVMPNIGLKYGEGVAALCKGRYATGQDLKIIMQIFEKLGKTLVVSEDKIDAITAVSGSGPGYFAYYAEESKVDYLDPGLKANYISGMTSAAMAIDFSSKDAKFLANNTYVSATAVLETEGITPKELERQVASPGGTTEAGLKELRKTGPFDKKIIKAVKAALARAKELGRR